MKVLGIFKEKCVFVFLGHSADSDVAMSPGRSKEHLFPESEQTRAWWVRPAPTGHQAAESSSRNP